MSQDWYSSGSVPRRLNDRSNRGEAIELSFEGQPVRAFEGESVAVALYASGKRVLSRSLKYHRPRGFFCLDGHCSGCLMRIDGQPNVRACMEPCRPNLTVEGQNAYPSPDFDVMEAVDWMFPKGMNHHTLMTGSKLLNSAMSKMVRQLSGLGTLPEHPPDEIPEVAKRTVDVVVIGAGPAGLAAAEASAKAGAETLLVDEHVTVGGSLLADPSTGPAEAARRESAARSSGAEILSGATAIAFFPEDDDGVLAIATRDQLVRLRARRYVYATGGYSVNRPFANNDRPGIVAARGVGRLLVEHGVTPSQRVCVIGDHDYTRALAQALDAAGCDVSEIDDRELKVVGALGRSWVTGIEVERDGKRRKLECDLVAVWATPAPATEGLRQHGCEVLLEPSAGGFAAITDDDGHTNVETVLACGDVCGYVGPSEAARVGARVGAVAAIEVSQ